MSYVSSQSAQTRAISAIAVAVIQGGIVLLLVKGLAGVIHLPLPAPNPRASDVPITVPISPLNRPPTASYTSTSPNTTTGAVTGQFTAVDPDGDGLTYDGTTVSRLGGQVTMGSNGNFTYTPSLALRNAAAHQPDGALSGDRHIGDDPRD